MTHQLSRIRDTRAARRAPLSPSMYVSPILFFQQPTYDGCESISSHRDVLLEYAAIFRQLPVPLAIVDHEFVILDASEAYALLAGRKLHELVGEPLAVAFNGTVPDDIVAAIRNGDDLDLAGTMADGEYRVRCASCGAATGDQVRMLVVMTPSGDESASETLSQLQQAVRTIRHEINNPLTGALGNINLLLRQANLDEKTRKRLTTAEQEIKKVSLIVLKLADLAPRPEADSADS